MKNILDWFNEKALPILLIVISVVSIIPILYMSKYNYPTGDDFGYSILTHTSWLANHSIIDLFRCSFIEVANRYIGWNGDWFTVFLFTFNPEVFVSRGYIIVAGFMIFFLIVPTSFFFFYITNKNQNFKFKDKLAIISIFLLCLLQYLPYSTTGIYWYVGAVHYTVSYGLSIMALLFCMKYIENSKRIWLLLNFLFMFMLGGGSWFSTLFILLTELPILILAFKHAKKEVILLWISYLVCIIGFVVQCIAPGNQVRGGADFGFSISWGVHTIIESIRQAVVYMIRFPKEHIIVCICIILLALIAWRTFLKSEKRGKYPLPILFILYSFGIFASMYAPVIYANTTEISGGPYNLQYITFLLIILANIFYIEGWLTSKLKDSTFKIMNEKISFISLVVYILLLLGVVVGRNDIKNSLNYRIYSYISSGQADDYKEQMEYNRLLLLDDNEKIVYLIPSNDVQGKVLLHMPVVENPKVFTNSVLAGFYGKKEVRLLQKDDSIN